MESYQEIFFAFSIGILVSMTTSRAIYLYYADEYRTLENRWDYRYDDSYQKKMDQLDKELTMKQFKIILTVATFLLIIGSAIRNQAIGPGLMVGAVIIILSTAPSSWKFLEEAEKFTLTVLSLSVLLVYVYYRFTPSRK